MLFRSRPLGVWFLSSCLLLGACATTRSQRRGAYEFKRMASAPAAQRVANVRVVILQSVGRLNAVSDGAVRLFDMSTRSVILETRLREDAQISVRGQSLMLNGQTLPAQKIRLVPGEGQFIKCNGRRYRGQMEITWKARGMLVVNILPLEDYLRGVVPNEVQYTWPPEALKAQAVAARTFALSRMNGPDSAEYDLDAGTNSQVYRGLDSERASTNEAVEGTARLVATAQGRFIAAFYHANCGGHTADVRHVWGSDIAYLKGVACGFCDDGAHHAWTLQLSLNELASALAQRRLEGIRGLAVLGRLPDGRVLSLEIEHAGGKEVIKAPVLRNLIGPDKLKSTNFDVSVRGKTVTFKGLGWGHGVGLCQEGACGMARSGYGFFEILEHYYPGLEIERLE